jgi:hypothetical protein
VNNEGNLPSPSSVGVGDFVTGDTTFAIHNTKTLGCIRCLNSHGVDCNIFATLVPRKPFWFGMDWADSVVLGESDQYSSG